MGFLERKWDVVDKLYKCRIVHILTKREFVQFVYKLYSLTEEEIAIVEGETA